MTPADTSGCGEFRQLLGVYVVGAIDPAERSAVDKHLASCSACRDELAGLAGLPALLGRVSLEEADRPADQAAATEPPDRLLDSMLDEMAKRRKARHRRSVLMGFVAVAASAVVAVGAFAGVDALVSGPEAGGQHHVAAAPNWDTESGHDPVTSVRAIVKYRPEPWGTEMSVWVAGVPGGTRCQLVLTDASGRRTVAGSWQALYHGGDAWYPGSSSVAAKSISHFEITSQGKTLVTVPA
jgi:Putative zinc-finger